MKFEFVLTGHSYNFEPVNEVVHTLTATSMPEIEIALEASELFPNVGYATEPYATTRIGRLSLSRTLPVSEAGPLRKLLGSRFSPCITLTIEPSKREGQVAKSPSTKALIDTIRANQQPLSQKFLREVADRLEELEKEVGE